MIDPAHQLMETMDRLTPADWKRWHRYELWKSQNGQCAYCGVAMLFDRPEGPFGRHDRRFMTIDHIVPISKGGLDIPANRVGACQDCNERKADGEAPPFVIPIDKGE